ncbi:hypothetical protein GS448_25930 [Rhodococcus hoagii]|nr:hypothetical protein [Prescottella equi]
MLADIEKLAALEALSPRGKHWICVSPWPYTDGFYLAATAARLEQVLDSVQAFASLHGSGRIGQRGRFSNRPPRR